MAGYMSYKHMQFRKREQGNILVMFTIGLFVLIAMAALAIDSGHLLLNKSRLQNIADAAALHAAKTLDTGGSHQEARAAVIEMITLNLAHHDNFEINNALELSALDTSATQVTSAISVDFSERPDPFVSSTSNDARYVKVEIRNLNLNNFLADIMNFTKRVSATALAGPSTAIEACPNDLVPMLVCAESPEGSITSDGMYGLPFEKLYAMKSGSANASDPAIGPGNFQLIRLGDNTGAADIREAMAGAGFTDADKCQSTLAVGDLVGTEPGNTVGPSAQGINTRLGDHTSVMKGTEDLYPADRNTCQGKDRVEILSKEADAEAATLASAAAAAVSGEDPVVYEVGDIDPATIDNAYRYSQYQNDEATCSITADGIVPAGGIDSSQLRGFQRRILKVVIGDCTGKNNGASDIPVLGTGCFFLTQTMGGGNDDFIIGEFAYDCSSVGHPSGVAEDNPGPYTIVLYHVPGSKDS